MAEWKPKGAVAEEDWTPSGAIAEESEPVREDWGDAGARAAPGPRDPSSIAPDPFGPNDMPLNERPGPTLLGIQFPNEHTMRGAVASFLQGPVLNLADEMAGLKAEERAAWGGATPEQGHEAYLRGRNAVRAVEGDFREANPKKAFGLTVAGGAGFGGPVQGAGSGAMKYLPAAVEGAVAGAGNADEAEDMAAQAVFGVPMGVLGQFLGEKAGQGIGWGVQKGAQFLAPHLGGVAGDRLSAWAAKAAAERALKASGYIQKDFPKEDAKRLALLNRGERLLEEPGLITPGATTATIGDRLEPLKQEAGERVGQYLAQAGDAAPVPSLTTGGGQFNAFAFADRVEREVLAPARKDPSLAQQAGTIRRWLDRLRRTARDAEASGEDFSFALANEMKGNLQKTIFSDRGDPLKNKELANRMQRLFIEAIDEQAAPMLGDDALRGFQQARSDYGTFTNAFEKAVQGENRTVGNQFFGLGDRLTAETAATVGGGIPGAAAAAIMSKLVRGRADSTAAAGLRSIANSDRLTRGLNTLSQADWLEDLARTNPEALGRWGAYLGAAASRSPEALDQAHYELGMTEPDYQERRRRAGGQEP